MSDTAAPAAETIATAPAPAVVASPAAPQKVGFLARMVGAEDTIRDLESRLSAEQATTSTLRTELAQAKSRVAEFEALESRLEVDLAAAQAAAATAQAAAASVPQQVAAGVADVVATLGVPEDTLAAVSAEPPKKSEEFAHLKGRDRAAAAFSSQFATA